LHGFATIVCPYLRQYRVGVRDRHYRALQQAENDARFRFRAFRGCFFVISYFFAVVVDPAAGLANRVLIERMAGVGGLFARR